MTITTETPVEKVAPPNGKRSWELERRTIPLTGIRVEHRAEGEPASITGHAAVFDQLSEPLFFFREKIEPGAFKKTIKEADVRALWNHDPNYVLGRTKSNTLSLAEDDVGLAIDIDPPDTQWSRDLQVSMQRGDVDQMSFGFRVVGERWEGTLDDPVRILEEVELLDVSPVTFPAYPQTDVGVRDNEMRSALAGPDQAVHPADSGRRQVPLTIRDRELQLMEMKT